MEDKYPEVETDWGRLCRLPFFTWCEIIEFLFGLDGGSLQLVPYGGEEYHHKASKTYYKLEEWMLREIEAGRLMEIPDSDVRCFASTEIKKWLTENNVIQWLIDQGIKVPPVTLKFFDFKPSVSPSGGGNKKTGHPAPTTPKAKSMALKQEAHAIYNLIRAQQDRVFAIDILGHSAWWAALVKSGYKGDYELNFKRLQKWVGDFRKLEKPADFQK